MTQATTAAVLNLQEQEEDTLKGKYLIFSRGTRCTGWRYGTSPRSSASSPSPRCPRCRVCAGHHQPAREDNPGHGRAAPLQKAGPGLRRHDLHHRHRHQRQIDRPYCGPRFRGAGHRGRGDRPPPNIGEEGHRYIKGIGKSGGDVKLLLDCEKLLTDDELVMLNTIG